MADKHVLGDRRPRGDDLRSGDDEPAVGLPLNVDEHVAGLLDRLIAVHRRVSDRMGEEEDVLLGVAVPAARVALVVVEVLGLLSEAGQQCRLVIGSPPHPAEDEFLPRLNGGDVVAQILRRASHTEERMCEATGSGIGGLEHPIPGLWRVQGIVQARHRPGRVAKRRVSRHVGDSLAVEPHLSAVAQ